MDAIRRRFCRKRCHFSVNCKRDVSIDNDYSCAHCIKDSFNNSLFNQLHLTLFVYHLLLSLMYFCSVFNSFVIQSLKSTYFATIWLKYFLNVVYVLKFFILFASIVCTIGIRVYSKSIMSKFKSQEQQQQVSLFKNMNKYSFFL